jgi:hypothetical protein
MTPAESVTALYGFYAKTVDHLGADGWAAVPADATVEGVTPDECRLVDGKTGVQYSDVLVGPGAQGPRILRSRQRVCGRTGCPSASTWEKPCQPWPPMAKPRRMPATRS